MPDRIREGVKEDRRAVTWHVGKEIPLALLCGILAQTAGFTWWLSALNASVEMQSRAALKLEAKVDAMNAAVVAPLAVSVARVERLEKEVEVLRLALTKR